MGREGAEGRQNSFRDNKVNANLGLGTASCWNHWEAARPSLVDR